ncbi:MAG: stage V sporulation protein AC [Oscillospiraceae bacterium]|nr:stage V sporulation protein AC [Oscillospiraceae bacterium]
MEQDPKQYKELYRRHMPRSNFLKDGAIAFAVGGAICALGQVFITVYGGIEGVDKDAAALYTSLTLIALSALATGLGVYDKLSRCAGAGTLVPITGFANAVVSPALEFKSEGYVLGTGAKMFIIAGPVIVYGTAASVVAGILYFLLR